MKPHPLFFASGKGPRLIDIDGHSYLDYVLGWGPVILGHSHPRLTEAVARQLPLGATFGACHGLEYEVAEQVLAAIPGTERVLWSNTGSEAAQVAVRLARAATGRQRFVKIIGHYHGWSDTFLLGYRPDATGQLDSVGSRGQRTSALADVSLVRFGDLDRMAEVLLDVSSDVAAVFVEPVLCNSGVLLPPDGYLAGLRELCDETGTVPVFDEVITGFRIAYGGAAERFGSNARPRRAREGNCLGYPMSAVAGRASVIDESLRGVVHAGTYNGNPVVLAAASATLEVLRNAGIYEAFEARGDQLAEGIRAAIARQGVPGAVNQVGSVVQAVFGVTAADSFEQFLAADQEFYDRLTVQLLRRRRLRPARRPLVHLRRAHRAGHCRDRQCLSDDALAATLSEDAGPVQKGARRPLTRLACAGLTPRDQHLLERARGSGRL